MSKSNASRFKKYWEKLIYSEADLYPEGYEGNTRFDAYGTPAPPRKIGKQFPYKNERPKIAPHLKSYDQQQIEAGYLGRNRHQLIGRKATHKHGGDGTVRRSSQRKAYHEPILEG